MATLKADADRQDSLAREARSTLDGIRASATQFEVSQATATADLAHLEATAVETVQATLADVLTEVEQLERDGAAVPDTRALTVDEGVDDGEEGSDPSAVDVVSSDAPHAITAEEAIAGLRAKIDRLGPVNMMAIEQFDELETRHTFLTTQRKDLIDSIAATNEAIQRIDETSTVRFRDAFEAINRNFQETFSTLFGGGHAGITLHRRERPARKRHRHRRQPPGKRLQSVQLLSGGEKALTAISLMFAIFRYKPSPFCLLDEIDAPLDDANIGRFVEMLKGMLAPHPVHPHHPQPQDHGDCGPALRRDDGGAWGVQVDIGPIELSRCQVPETPAPHPPYHSAGGSNMRRVNRHRALPVVLVATLAFGASGCDVNIGGGDFSLGVASGRAADEWSRSYTDSIDWAVRGHQRERPDPGRTGDGRRRGGPR